MTPMKREIAINFDRHFFVRYPEKKSTCNCVNTSDASTATNEIPFFFFFLVLTQKTIDCVWVPIGYINSLGGRG